MPSPPRIAPWILAALCTVAPYARAQPAAEAPLPGAVGSKLSPEQITAEEFAEMKEMGRAMAAELRPSRGGPRAEELDATPAPTDLSPEELSRLLARLGRSFYFGMRMGKRLGIEGELSFFPALADGKLELKWTKVVGPGGKNVLGKPERAPKGEWRRAGDSAPSWSKEGLRIEATLPLTVNAERPGLVRAEGTATLAVPLRYQRAPLPCTAGARAALGSGSATVRRCQGDFVELDLIGPGEPVLLIRNAAGKRLAVGASNSMPLLAGGRTPLEIEYRDLPLLVEGRRVSLNVLGQVAALELALPAEVAQRTQAVVATPEPAVVRDQPVKVAAARTLWEPPAGTGLVVTTAAAVRAGTRVLAGRTYAVMDYNQPKVVVRLPRLDNSLYASIDFGAATLLDAAGKPVPHQQESVWVQWPSLENEVRFSGEGSAGPLSFARAQGTARVRYPVAMRTVVLTRAAPAAGPLRAEFHGARLALFGENDDGPRLSSPTGAPRAFDLLRAYDEHGERLQQIGPDESNGERHQVAFWGEPAEVRLVVADRWEELELSYDLPPAPLLPADRAGQRPE